MKTYTSYKELNRDLRILKLEAEISKQKIKINKELIKEDLSPVTLISSFAGSMLKKAFILQTVSKLLGKK